MRSSTVIATGLLAFASAMQAAEPKVITPANGVPPVGPYSPGLEVGGYVYVSGQGVRDAKGVMPNGIEAQTRQAIENVRVILDAAGLKLDSVVSVQLYVTDLKNLPAVEKIYKGAFPKNPARITLGVAKMPTDTTVEITVVARKGAEDRVYKPAVYGSGVLAPVKDAVMTVLYAAGVAAEGMVPVDALPDGAQRAVFAATAPKPLAGLAYCPVVYSDPKGTVEEQTSSAFGKLKTCLASKGMTLADVVATNVYLDDIADFTKMNGVYATFFPVVKPTRTTVQPVAASHKGSLVMISALAAK